MHKNKFLNNLSFNIFTISGTLLAGYVLSKNEWITKESAILTFTCVSSGLSLIKMKRNSFHE